MRRLTAFIPVALVSCSVLQAAAQTPPRLAPPARSTNEIRQPADSFVAASLTAHGGGAMPAIRSIVLRGVSIVAGEQQPVMVSATVEGYSRIEWGDPINRTMVTTPTGRFEIRGQTLILRAPHSGAYTALDIFSGLGIRDVYAGGDNRGVVGNTRLGGRDVLRIHVGRDRLQSHYGRVLKDELDIDLDPDTGLLAAVHRWEYADESLDLPFVTTYTFSAYGEVAGVVLPFRIARYTNGKLKETIAVQSFEINPVFDRDFFEMER